MRSKNVLLMLLVVILGVSSTFAVGNGTIRRIATGWGADGNDFFYFTNEAGIRYILPSSTPAVQKKEMLAMLLMAMNSGHWVSLRITSSYADGNFTTYVFDAINCVAVDEHSCSY